LSHYKHFTQPRFFRHHRYFKPRGHIRHGLPSIHARPFTQRGRRFGYYRNFTRQSRSSDGYLRGLGIR
jgi:hypothetical protein